MDNEEETVYQYYTIISDSDAFITNQENDEEDDDKVMYLALGQEDGESYNPDVILEDSMGKSEDMGMSNVELISLEDGQMYITDSSSLDDSLSKMEPELISCSSNEGSIFLSENSSKAELAPSDNESDFRKIQLEDGTCAYIDKSLWNSLIENIEGDEKQNMHTTKKEKKYQCTYFGCNKVYTTAHHLTVHVRNHTGFRPYQCTMGGCQKAFATGYSLKAHLRTHTGEAPYSCTICPKQFKTSGDLQKHVRTHTGEKPFKCPIEGCGRSFTTSNIRKVHIRSHTGERPYACTYADCGKAFASATNFKNHLRIHSGEKPYECSVQGCGKRFTEYSSLFKHNAVHKPFKNLKCEYCDQPCKHEVTLRAHKQSVHKILVTEDGTEIRLTK